MFYFFVYLTCSVTLLFLTVSQLHVSMVWLLLLDKVLLFYLFFVLCFVVFKGTGVFVYYQDGSKESIRHKKIQSNLELVLLCISLSAVILALILLTTLR